eukprot:TRINITY_DN1271_c0_g2_i2.p1 TRINITY_DN1271_c0_g2~~TRINITY_DN1271_c0_g2_i2.p1  ORF type:complete len:143 (+),score=25.50 TRINITY_DN1271_c0_g2_i2:65-430(+)
MEADNREAQDTEIHVEDTLSLSKMSGTSLHNQNRSSIPSAGTVVSAAGASLMLGTHLNSQSESSPQQQDDSCEQAISTRDPGKGKDEEGGCECRAPVMDGCILRSCKLYGNIGVVSSLMLM